MALLVRLFCWEYYGSQAVGHVDSYIPSSTYPVHPYHNHRTQTRKQTPSRIVVYPLTHRRVQDPVQQRAVQLAGRDDGRALHRPGAEDEAGEGAGAGEGEGCHGGVDLNVGL